MIKNRLLLVFLFYISTQFIYAEVRHFTIQELESEFKVYERIKNSFDYKTENDIIHITNSKSRDWAYYHTKKYKAELGSFYEVSCEARNNNSNYCVMQITSLCNGKVIDYGFASSDPFVGSEWNDYFCRFIINDGIDEFYFRFIGSGVTDLEIRNVKIRKLNDFPINSYSIAFNNDTYISVERNVEGDRALIATATDNGNLISWRKLNSDTQNVFFDIVRVRNGVETKINDTPLIDVTNILDQDGFINDEYKLYVNNILCSYIQVEKQNYKLLKLTDNRSIERIAFEDLDGDKKLDFIVKGPHGSIDPYGVHHKPSKDTYYIAAYNNDGTFMWKKDLGWNIEKGIWYSPFIVCDLDGDGKAEIIVKTSEYNEDYRSKDGKIFFGPEYLTVLDGLTGEELVKTDWINRFLFENYNLASRNQLAIAYLDGVSPYIIEERGTYGLMIVKAYKFQRVENNFSLKEVFCYSNAYLNKDYRGQGAHQTLCVDVDNDGCDEIILGSTVLDNDGSILWNLGKGHPDGVYFGDFNPNNPGNEIVYIYETKQKYGGILMVDAKTGNILWQLGEPTNHVHGRGFCADVFPEFEGFEIFGRECIGDHEFSEKCWLFSGTGELLDSGKNLYENYPEWDFSPMILYWDNLPYKNIYSKKLIDTKGFVITAVDVYGDWREELITASGDEVRIYCTPYSTDLSYPWLLLDKDYNSIIRMNTSGYVMCPSIYFNK